MTSVADSSGIRPGKHVVDIRSAGGVGGRSDRGARLS